MKTPSVEGAMPSPYLTPIDLNDLLLDHPAASFIFEVGDDLAIADRAANPTEGGLVIVEAGRDFFAEPYHGQQVFAVITYILHRLT